MYSKKLLSDIVDYCCCMRCDNSDAAEGCTHFEECVYKPECDNIRYQYGCSPCGLQFNKCEE